MIREAIRQRFIDLGITQKAVCAAIGETPQNLSVFLNGGRTYPYCKFVTLLEALGLTIGSPDKPVGAFPPSEIGACMDERMREHRMRRKELADESGVNTATLSSFLSGKRSISLRALDKMLPILGLGIVCYGEPLVA